MTDSKRKTNLFSYVTAVTAILLLGRVFVNLAVYNVRLGIFLKFTLLAIFTILVCAAWLRDRLISQLRMVSKYYILIVLAMGWLIWLALIIFGDDLGPFRGLFRDLLVISTFWSMVVFDLSVAEERMVTHLLDFLSRPLWRWCGRKITMADGLIFIGILGFSTLSFLGHWQGRTGFVQLSSDPANIASFVAAREHPDRKSTRLNSSHSSVSRMPSSA